MLRGSQILWGDSPAGPFKAFCPPCHHADGQIEDTGETLRIVREFTGETPP